MTARRSPPWCSSTDRGGVLLHLIRTARREFTGAAELLDDPVLRERADEYVTDLVHPYGLRVDATARGQSYGEMAASLIPALVPDDEPVDLLVLAFAVHDALPGRATAAYLSHVCPGTPMSFALCDQGSAAAFTGLRIARASAYRRVLLLVVEQSVLAYDQGVAVPERHRAVALLLGGGPADGGARVTALRQHADVGPDDVAGRAAAELRALGAGSPDVAVVLGAGLAAAGIALGASPVTAVPAGQSSTGVWWALPDLLGDPWRPRVVLVADYEPDLRYLSLVTLTHG
ncbi:2-hydroxy-acid oxidase [Micromonospora sp. WMMD980]|uniref:2-hydroxy-acid oxidase n=1 Tax=Micromonospora sp. WMMD980 TaxID=3016088 RepID=UPI0024177DAE|nr:2-hydroxy-acid oxidase [Micromonospora sp. WMMD980]MDG4800280.1 2-hydroxy-acid oxidase [Micromonospora sp. WMMD980]